jgi:hypothetical protein
MKEQI